MHFGECSSGLQSSGRLRAARGLGKSFVVIARIQNIYLPRGAACYSAFRGAQIFVSATARLVPTQRWVAGSRNSDFKARIVIRAPACTSASLRRSRLPSSLTDAGEVQTKNLDRRASARLSGGDNTWSMLRCSSGLKRSPARRPRLRNFSGAVCRLSRRNRGIGFVSHGPNSLVPQD